MLYQFAVEKQGSINQYNWHGCVLSATREPVEANESTELEKKKVSVFEEDVVLYLSQKDRPDRERYHRMRPVRIETYPNYNITRLGWMSDQRDGPLCFCIKGYRSPGPDHKDYKEWEEGRVKEEYGFWMLRMATTDDIEIMLRNLNTLNNPKAAPTGNVVEEG